MNKGSEAEYKRETDTEDQGHTDKRETILTNEDREEKSNITTVHKRKTQQRGERSVVQRR